ncbi:MAG: damage-inducible protein DinB [Rhodospirillales bacterium]|nr:damage-inducible protein DinB [Rhodospirillales bacterium]
MITPAYVRTMAAYNTEMNRRLYAAAARLSDAERRRDHGAFWGSIHGTFSHLLWGDSIWMSRFAGWPKPEVTIKESARMIEDFAALVAARETADVGISAWAGGLDEAWLAADQTWFSGGAGRERTAPRALLVAHMFNHQSHHRGQAHALITRAGERTGETDLFLVVPAIA